MWIDCRVKKKEKEKNRWRLQPAIMLDVSFALSNSLYSRFYRTSLRSSWTFFFLRLLTSFLPSPLLSFSFLFSAFFLFVRIDSPSAWHQWPLGRENSSNQNYAITFSFFWFILTVMFETGRRPVGQRWMTEPLYLEIWNDAVHYRSFTRSKMQMSAGNRLYCCHIYAHRAVLWVVRYISDLYILHVFIDRVAPTEKSSHKNGGNNKSTKQKTWTLR